jgi:outer membrane protein OmpA-like peptidoglycan-associated protein
VKNILLPILLLLFITTINAQNPERFNNIQNLDINTEYAEFGVSFYKTDLVLFASSKKDRELRRKDRSNNKMGYLEFYKGLIGTDGQIILGGQFSLEKYNIFHESDITFTPDGKTIYFTLNNYIDDDYREKFNKSTDKKHILNIFKANIDDAGIATNIEPVSFNSKNHSVRHPELSPDGKTLYFVSDMKGGFGDEDIYKVAINDDGTYGEPKNLGKGINTEGRENFPFISQSNEFYFSSDGHVGLGGLDIFVMNLDIEDSEIFNIGEPVNSSMDDFTFIINNKTKKGYFASNRDGGKGDDDIYSFIQTKPIQWTCEQEIAGVVKDEKTNEIIGGANVKLFDKDNIELENTYSEVDGKFRFKKLLDCNEVYFVRASKKDYNSAEALLPKQEEKGLREVTLLLEKEEVPFEVGDDLAKILNIPIIYFDFDKSNIRPDAAAELEKVVAVMKEYQTLKIDVRSHTDSRGTDSYNMKLSQRRNESTRAYIVSRGIDVSRLIGAGYGETRHVNKCKNGVKCSEEEHQLNRRSEFIVTER